MMRIPYPPIESLSEAKRAVVGDGYETMLNISRALLHLPDAFWLAQRGLARATIYDATIGDATRELVILRVAALSSSEYELFHHLSIAAKVGVASTTRDAMCSGDFTALPSKERTLAEFVTELVRDVSPGDAALAAMRNHFSDGQLFEIVAVVGYYMLIARIAAVAGIPKDVAAVSAWPGRQN